MQLSFLPKPLPSLHNCAPAPLVTAGNATSRISEEKA